MLKCSNCNSESFKKSADVEAGHKVNTSRDDGRPKGIVEALRFHACDKCGKVYVEDRFGKTHMTHSDVEDEIILLAANAFKEAGKSVQSYTTSVSGDRIAIPKKPEPVVEAKPEPVAVKIEPAVSKAEPVKVGAITSPPPGPELSPREEHKESFFKKLYGFVRSIFK